MPKPLNIYSFIPKDCTISYGYRLETVFKTAADLGLNVRTMVDTNIEGISPEERIKNFCEADIVVLYQPVGDGTLNNVRMAKSFIPSKREGAWKYPPTFILDTDDNLFRVDPHNPAYQNLGIADPETGREIPKGFQIAEVRDGKRSVLWKDGENGFDVERNKATLETYRQLINEADCVTTTTPRTAEYIKEHASPRRTKVLPNLMRFDQYPQIDLIPSIHKVKILWQGGQNHWPDWRPLKDQVGRITRDYPNVHWIMWGVQYAWVTEVIPPDRMTFLPWCDWREYRLRRVMIGEDISLAPLTPNPFNNCRSAIKFYEACMPKRPAATLAQNTGPYADEILDGETGVLFDTPAEFELKLRALIENPATRKQLGKNGKQWVSEHRDAMKEVPKIIQFYEQLRSEIEYDQPHMSENEWSAFEQQMQQQAGAEAKQLQPA